mmetsp:Transcript_32403/g.48851  ORF Transcript_32403/g.48851 Transcript_32403/m.48851 type:complete len:259 (-) Transcript_32403:87-863(-)|eukprot:CAMPEP_0178919954 /NCGR_PEP_ID=MMETSP0786-20121207/14731_1 /TAXON_ID=186022 /ORGANISM="Thalassionema frauenfeldii, Strain CCMP 1798" /LENGTH=258 /DNA_ID=CAMNT_0020593957 /DNA_START=138 /DNA_END=914 /DNA_ORIENTATION=+
MQQIRDFSDCTQQEDSSIPAKVLAADRQESVSTTRQEKEGGGQDSYNHKYNKLPEQKECKKTGLETSSSRDIIYKKLASDAMKQYALSRELGRSRVEKLDSNTAGVFDCGMTCKQSEVNHLKKIPQSRQLNHEYNESKDRFLKTGQLYRIPHYFDVLCGRSKTAFDHPGNHIFRAKIAKHMDEYTKCNNRSGKTSIILKVISSVLEDGGSFLKYDSEKEMWYDGGMNAAKIRVSTAFRDAGIPNKNKSIDRLREKTFS